MANLKYTLVFICITSTAVGSQALGAPVISELSGRWNHDGIITIAGTGFGSKPSATPVLWDTVDNAPTYSSLQDGSTIPIGGSNPWKSSYGNSSGRNLVKYENTANEQRGVSEASYKAVNTRNAYLDGLTWPETDSLYISWWWKQDRDTRGDNHSSKWLRVSDANDQTGKTFSWTSHQSIIYAKESGYCANSWSSFNPEPSTWYFMEAWFDNANQRFSNRVNGQPINDNASWSPCTSIQMNQIWKLGFDGGGNAPPSISWWMDDIYVDSSFSRVMLGDAASYSDSTHFEMQKAASWYNTRISIEVNQGTYSSGSTAYLYVVDSQGNVNQLGHPVVISSDVKTASPPKAPTAMSVTTIKE